MYQIYVGSLAFFYRARTPWRERFDEGITRLIEAGLINKYYQDYMGDYII